MGIRLKTAAATVVRNTLPCQKVEHRVECLEHGYPYSEAAFPDRQGNPLPCDRDDAFYEGWIEGVCNG